MEDLNWNELYQAAANRIQDWLHALGANLPNFALSILVLVGSYFLAKTVKRLSKKYLLKLHSDVTIGSFVSRLLFLGVLVTGLMLALSILDLTKTVSSLLAGLGIVGLALGFAFQDTAANFMSGIYITFNQPYAVGDVIETNDGTMGYVADINLRVTKVRTFNGPVVYVPNRFLFQETFTNFSDLGERRLQLECGISYGEDLEEVERITLEVLRSVDGRMAGRAPTVHWQGFGDSSIDFVANIWLNYRHDHSVYVNLRNDLIKKLKKAFDQNGITIPFPIRTLDFGIKGGVRLHEEMGGDKGSLSKMKEG